MSKCRDAASAGVSGEQRSRRYSEQACEGSLVQEPLANDAPFQLCRAQIHFKDSIRVVCLGARTCRGDNDQPNQMGTNARYDRSGRLIHPTCAIDGCKKSPAFGCDVALREGKLGTWVCYDHWPRRSKLPDKAPGDLNREAVPL